MQMERKRNGIVAELETGHVGCDRLIRRVQPPQICVEVASCPTGQRDVIPLDGFPRLDSNLPGLIQNYKAETVSSVLHVCREIRMLLARDPILDTELLDARPGMSNLQLFPVSSLLIGSTLPVDRNADGTPALVQLERSCVWAPGEPDCACLFRLLESILCSVREDSCYYNSVLFSSCIPSSSVFLTSGGGHIPLGNSPTIRD